MLKEHGNWAPGNRVLCPDKAHVSKAIYKVFISDVWVGEASDHWVVNETF